MGGMIADADVAAWPYSVGISCKFTAFLGTLHWPVDAVDMGHLGVFFFKKKKKFLSFFEQWAGHRLLSEKVTRPHVRAVPVSEGIEIRHGFSFVAWLGPHPNCLEVWVGSCHVVLATTCPGNAIWGGIDVLTVSLPDHQNLVINGAIVRFVGVLGYPMGLS